MRTTLAALLLIFAFPVAARANIPAGISFGGFDLFTFPTTCSLPAFLSIPNCPGGAPPFAPPDPPLYHFDFFGPLYQGLAAPTGGILAVPLTTTSLYTPGVPVVPGTVSLGYVMPSPSLTGGFYIPGLILPNPYGPPICIPSICAAMAPAIGIVTPNVGTAVGGFGF